MEFSINYMAMVVAAVVNMALGFLWYGPIFGKAWMKMVGLKKEDVEKISMVQPMIIASVGALVMAYVLSGFVQLYASATAVDGAIVGFWIWLGFIATTTLSPIIWENKPWSLYVLNNGYYLVLLLANGALLTVWR